jgi:hypothetical protein
MGYYKCREIAEEFNNDFLNSYSLKTIFNYDYL